MARRETQISIYHWLSPAQLTTDAQLMEILEEDERTAQDSRRLRQEACSSTRRMISIDLLVRSRSYF